MCICCFVAASRERAVSVNGNEAGVVQAEGEVGGARAQLVTGYAEHRASLSEKKQYRRAMKIDLKLPEASTALAGVPRKNKLVQYMCRM